MKGGQQLNLEQLRDNGNFCSFFLQLGDGFLDPWSLILSLLQFKCDYVRYISMKSSYFSF